MAEKSDSFNPIVPFRAARKRIENGCEGASALVSGILLSSSIETEVGFNTIPGYLFPVPSEEMIAAYTHFFVERLKDARGMGKGLPPGMRPEDIYLRMLEDEEYLREDCLVFVSRGPSNPSPGSRTLILTLLEDGRFLTFTGETLSPEDDLTAFARVTEEFTAYLLKESAGVEGNCAFMRIYTSVVL